MPELKQSSHSRVYSSVLAQLFWNSADYWPLASGLGLALIVVTIWLYRAQTAGLPGRWQFLLPAFRVAAICGVCVSLLKPTLLRPRTEQEHGAIVILVDRSASMAIIESQMAPARRVALADAAGLLPEKRRTSVAPDAVRGGRVLAQRLDRLARAESDLEYARLTARQTDLRLEEYQAAFSSALTKAHELSAALSLSGQQEPVNSQAALLGESPKAGEKAQWRKKILDVLGPMEAALNVRQAASDAALYNADAAVREISNKVALQSRLSLVEKVLTNGRGGLLSSIGPDVPLYGYGFADHIEPLPLRAGGATVKQLLIEPTGGQSRISGSIASAMEDIKGVAVRAVVVVSDGRAVGESASARLVTGSVPVFTIRCGEEQAFTDLSIVGVDMPASAYVGEEVTARATIKATNIPPGEYPITMKFGEQQLSHQVKLEASGTAQVQFTFKADKAGVGNVQLSAKLLPGEASEENNSASRSLKVIQGKLNILMVTANPSWDFQYLRNALSRTKWATLTDVVAGAEKLLLDPEKILQQNVIVLFRVSPAMLTAQQVDAIHRAVTERGASVIITPGLGEDMQAFARDPLLGELLPYRPGTPPVWRSWPGDRPAFRIVPDGQASTLDALKLSDDPAESTSRWMNLPAIYHYLSIPQLKPNAIRTLLVENESRAPVLVESRLGIGRVLFLGLHESWRWRMRVGDRDQDRFWLQLIRYSAEEPYALVSDTLAMDVDRVTIRPGEDFRLRARVNAGAAAVVEVQQGGKVVRIEKASPGMQPGRFEAIIRDLPEGSYDIVVKSPGAGAGSSLQLPVQVRYGMEEELGDVSADGAALAQISAISGGTSVMLDQASDISRQLTEVRHRSGGMLEIPLWSSSYLFLFVLGCLAVEWAVRKRVGLA